jgi:hypothetical protein
MMTAGAFGLGAIGRQSDAQDAEAALKELKPSLQGIDASLRSAFQSNSLAQGSVAALRTTFTNHYKANNRFPAFVDVGFGVFYDVYDWHIKHNQPVLVNRSADGRLSVDFMFTRLYVRVEYSEMQIGIPYDRA